MTFRDLATANTAKRGYFDLKDVVESVDIVQVIMPHVALTKGAGEWRGRCPFHADGHPSFVVVPKMQRFHCYGCMPEREWGDAIDFIRKLKGCDYREAARILVGNAAIEFCDADRARIRGEAAVKQKADDEKAEKNRRMALASWESARPIGGSPAEAYLRARGISSALPAHALRFVPELFCKEVSGELPAMVAAFVDARGSFMALHRTWLARGTEGAWRKAALDNPKMTLGKLGGGAIRLAPREDVPLHAGATLYVAEGIETALSVREGLRGRADLRENAAVWAAGSLSNMSRLVLPNEDGGEACLFGTVVLCIDLKTENDRAKSATEAAWALETYGARGCKVLMMEPAVGADFNDMLTRPSPQAAE